MKCFAPFRTLTQFEALLWAASCGGITICFLLGEAFSLLTLIASLIGVTALIFVAKGDVLGQILTVVFSLLYALISLRQQYYGEMITYLGMTAPIAALSVVSWLRHPYEGGKREVQVARLTRRQIAVMLVLAALTTALFYPILAHFNTARLLISTVSITTSFLASYLTFCRSCMYALAYAANDVVLIVLWILAALENPAYLPMVLCFVLFFCNDLYGFFSWRKMQQRQSEDSCTSRS